jgi:tetratricopeptide (TPR) repeat protein
MVAINAFIGHSFTEDDAILVGKFLRYFDQLSKSDLNFSYVHAEAAEPRVLAEKVKSLLADRNVLVAICTKKERVISPDALSTALLPRGFLKAPKDQFLWKTSDWIIQEIGLAIGRGLSLILLLEEGVQKPGGLQGDLEYIPFDRDSPERSFGKIIDMLSALSPKARSVEAATDPRSPVTDESKAAATPSTENNWWIPQPDWNRRRYDIALYVAIDREESDKIEAIYQAYLTTPDAGLRDNKQRWEAYREYLRLHLGKGGTVLKLRELAAANEHSSGTLAQLANALAKVEHHEEAAQILERAASETDQPGEVFRLLGAAAVQYAKAKAQPMMRSTISRLKAMATAVPNGELRLLRVLRDVAPDEEDDVKISIMERIVDLDPDDDGTRFSLAYRYSEKQNNDLSLFHYLKIPESQRSGASWNNVGVEYERGGLPAKSIGAYRAAGEMGETLAMSNLAQRFMSGGFLSEAEKICIDALKIENFHENVATTMGEVRAVPAAEDEKQVNLLEKAQIKSEFYRQFGRAVSREEPTELANQWSGPDCDLTVKLSGTEFIAVGSYARPKGALFAIALGVPPSSEPDRFRVEYRGVVRGRAIEGFVTRTKEGASHTLGASHDLGLLSATDDKKKVLLVLSDNGNEMKAMENPEIKTPLFYTLRSKASAA